MRRVSISEAEEVVNIKDGSQSWLINSVHKSPGCEDFITLYNNDKNSCLRCVQGCESVLEEEGFVGFAQ